MSEPTYHDGKTAARVGDIVLPPEGAAPRGIVIAVEEDSVLLLLIGVKKETGETVVLPDKPTKYLAGQCHYMEKQTLCP